MVDALGVVFGDIGTSPIFAFHEALKAAGETAGEATILGVLSLVFWAVVLAKGLTGAALFFRNSSSIRALSILGVTWK